MARKKPARSTAAGGELSNEQIFQGLANLPDEKIEAILDSLYGRATGCYIVTKFRKVGQSADGQVCMTFVLPDCEHCREKFKEFIEFEEGHLYKILPDTAALRMFVEYNAGRPATRVAQKADPNITIKHCIPGKPEWEDDALTKRVGHATEDVEAPPIPVSLQEPDMGWEPKDDPWQSTG